MARCPGVATLGTHAVAQAHVVRTHDAVLAAVLRGAAPGVPRDSTGDQWFDDGQFSAYLNLGRAMGDELAKAVDADARHPDGAVGQRGAAPLERSRDPGGVLG